MGGLEAAALVNGDVDQHRALAHELQILALDQLGRRGAGDQHAADHQVGGRQEFQQGSARREHRAGAALEVGVQHGEPGRGDVHDGHVGAHADGDLGGVEAGDAAAQDDHLGGRHAGHAAHQDAASAGRRQQIVGADLGGHAPGHLAHGGEQRQAAALVEDGLIGDGGDAGGEQVGLGDDRRRPVRPCEQGVPGRLAVLDERGGRLVDRHRHDPCVGQPGETTPGDLPADLGESGRGRDPAAPLPVEGEGDDRDPLMAESLHVTAQLGGADAVLDPDLGDALEGFALDRDDGDAAASQRREVRVVGRGAADEHGDVHHGGLDERVQVGWGLVGRAGDQQDAEPERPQRARQTVEHLDRHRVAERATELVADQDADDP
ncbi:hypothetical protein GALL_489400 [mine drainage metagenome]|uniref:Uncharacterized protein n=1 Tax=mine drainage metagenome TaxID=410659 RepID=A0A1J5PPE9_9ZZZZ